jgi:hypothetical protein
MIDFKYPEGADQFDAAAFKQAAIDTGGMYC